jgi:hypothetical protein
VNGQLGLQLGDPPLRGRQLSRLGTGQPRQQSPVDAALAAPGVDRLLADPQIPGHISDAAPGLNKIYNLPAELPRVTPSAHSGLLVSGHQNPVIKLHRSRDTPAVRVQHSVTFRNKAASL